MHKLTVALALTLVWAAVAPPLLAQDAEEKPPPLPPHPVRAHDFPNDQGNKILIAWICSVDDPEPKLPTIRFDFKAGTNPKHSLKSPMEKITYAVERDHFLWDEELRRPVAEMLKIQETDPEQALVLAPTFVLYLAGIAERHLRDPLELAEALDEPAAWLKDFAGRLDLSAEKPEEDEKIPSEEEIVDLLLKRIDIDDPRDTLRATYEQGESTYIDLVSKLKLLVPGICEPGRLYDAMMRDDGMVAAMQKLLDGSNLETDRLLFMDYYTAARAQIDVRDRQAKALEELREHPTFGPIIRSGRPRQQVASYEIERADSPDGPWRVIGTKVFSGKEFEDSGAGLEDGIEPGKDYFYRIVAVGTEGGRSVSEWAKASSSTQWWHTGRTNNFFAVTIFIALIIGWIWAAGKRLPVSGIVIFSALTLMLGIFAWLGMKTPINWATLGCLAGPVLAFLIVQRGKKAKELYIRPIAGIQAVEEAIGRATEMGKPILYVPGLSSIEDIATLASLNILGPVAEKAAEYDSKIIVPNRDPIVFTIAQEIVKESYLRAGRPDSFDAGNIYFVTGRQFAYAAAVNGLMLREKPATNFFLGMFWAESLLLAETGSMTGAIQIAGTDAVTQLPFFIVACDYTLIGEELYAAGAYMGRDPKLLGGLKGQDFNKAILLVALGIVALLFFGLDVYGVRTDLTDGLRDIFKTMFKVEN